jgi:hypothetical protein
VIEMSKGLFTDGFVLDEEVEEVPFTVAYVRMRERAERMKYNPPVTRWGEAEKALAESRLEAMAKPDSPEAEAALLNNRIRLVETEIRVQDVLDRLVNNSPTKGK